MDWVFTLLFLGLAVYFAIGTPLNEQAEPGPPISALREVLAVLSMIFFLVLYAVAFAVWKENGAGGEGPPMPPLR